MKMVLFSLSPILRNRINISSIPGERESLDGTRHGHRGIHFIDNLQKRHSNKICYEKYGRKNGVTLRCIT